MALTFDAEHPDRPGCPPGAAERILDTLRGAGVRATFFLQGRWAESQPETAWRIANDGHRIGNHSTFHARMSLLTDEGLRTDIRTCDEVIRTIAGADPRPWFRCPFGDAHDDPRVLRAVNDAGYRNVHWHVAAEDWERSAEEVERRTLEGVADHGDGAVVLLHTWPASTAESLPAVLDRLGESGTRFVTVDALEELP